MKPSRDISRLIEIMAALRTPVTGCPWDLEQNFETILPYTIEETYEVADAILRDDREDLREELGDLLLQVVYHARMAEEEGSFSFGDVVEDITKKMVRRHPHVFGDECARNAGMAKGMWEKIKAAEKLERIERRTAAGLHSDEPKSHLDTVPASMTPLLQAVKLQERASKVGFDWNDPGAVIAKIREELAELEDEFNGTQDAREDELGDILFALANLARHLKIDPETALARTNRKFRTRFAHIEQALTNQGRKLADAMLDEMEAHWQAAKKI